MIRIKICCISSITEARTAISFGATAIGLVGKMPSGQGVITDERKLGSFQDIRENLPSVKIVHVIHVLDEKSIDQALKISEKADALLLDSGNPNLAVKELGGVRTDEKLDQKKLEAFFKVVWG